MDPQATWQLLIDAYADRDWSQADEAAEAMLYWLDRSGFPPQTIASRQMDAEWNTAIVRSACQFVLRGARSAAGGRSAE